MAGMGGCDAYRGAPGTRTTWVRSFPPCDKTVGAQVAPDSGVLAETPRRLYELTVGQPSAVNAGLRNVTRHRNVCTSA